MSNFKDFASGCGKGAQMFSDSASPACDGKSRGDYVWGAFLAALAIAFLALRGRAISFSEVFLLVAVAAYAGWLFARKRWHLSIWLRLAAVLALFMRCVAEIVTTSTSNWGVASAVLVGIGLVFEIYRAMRKPV